MGIAAWLVVRLLFILETGAILIFTTLALDAPQFAASWFRKMESIFGRLARHQGMTVAAVGLLALIARAALLPVEPIPAPTVHDEFSYLLAADTFASGRLANPPHPLWMHFETMQEDLQPAYASMYPPAQGLVLALGKSIFGHPFAGVCLSAALMCAAICWMLQGWLPPGWALLGGFLVIIRLATFTYWADSYWGGAVAAAGGALVLGVLPRILRRKRPTIITALVLTFGVALLLNSRPYEGAVLSAAAVGVLVVQFMRNPVLRGPLLRRCFLPAILAFLPVLAFMAYYNFRAFGAATKLPYQVNRATYAMAKVFVWENPSPEPAYNHPVMREFFARWEMNHFDEVRSGVGIIRYAVEKIETGWRFFIGPVLTLPLLVCFRKLSDRRIRALVIVAAIFIAALAVQAWFQPHYAAPATALIWVLLLQGMRHLRIWRWRNKPAGLALVRAVPVICILLFGVRIGFGTRRPIWLRWPFTWATVWDVSLHREEVRARLQNLPGPHLVIVRYSATHDPLQEYVFNDADIDHSPIVWAREMDPAHNQLLTAYFKKRVIWLLEPDGPGWKLSPYPGSADPTLSLAYAH